MTVTDYIFLVACLLALGLMVFISKVIRAIFWETLRHPFRPSRIQFDQGQIVVNPSKQSPAEDKQPKRPAGAH